MVTMATTKHQKVTIRIGKGFSASKRREIAKDLIDTMIDQAEAGKGIYKGKRRKFPGYSDAYTKSLDFKIAGKSKNSVDLTLSGDMLAAIELLEDKENRLVIGFPDGSSENARADGNIRGTYGGKAKAGKARPFLGVTEAELQAVLDKHRG